MGATQSLQRQKLKDQSSTCAPLAMPPGRQAAAAAPSPGFGCGGQAGAGSGAASAELRLGGSSGVDCIAHVRDRAGCSSCQTPPPGGPGGLDSLLQRVRGGLLTSPGGGGLARGVLLCQPGGFANRSAARAAMHLCGIVPTSEHKRACKHTLKQQPPSLQVHEFQSSLAAVSEAPGLGLSEAAELLQRELGAATVG
jgi:hypothetical protein